MSARSIGTKPRRSRSANSKKIYDVIVVGAGPAGSVLGWKLAQQGVSVLLLEASKFPRKKVCGDYIEPPGLRILETVGCLEKLESGSPLPITHAATFVDSQCRYRARIPFYGRLKDLPPHGYVIPREQLDELLFPTAAKAGTNVREYSIVRHVSCV